MGYFNTNILKDVGIKHSYPNGTLVQKYNDATNATVTLHTVTAGKTFYLEYFSASTAHALASVDYYRLVITDASDTVTFEIFKQKCYPNGTNSVAVSLFKPIVIPAGYKVKLHSNHASVYACASICGYEE